MALPSRQASARIMAERLEGVKTLTSGQCVLGGRVRVCAGGVLRLPDGYAGGLGSPAFQMITEHVSLSLPVSVAQRSGREAF